MSRFLFVCEDAGGTIPPVIAICEELIARGHFVAVLSQPSVRARAEAAGCVFIPFASIPDYAVGVSLEDQLDIGLIAITGRGPGDDLVRAAREVACDVVVVDGDLAGTAAAAESLACPSAILLTHMYQTYVDCWFGEYWPFLAPAINETRVAYGLAAADGWAAVFSPHERLISVVPPGFEAATDFVPDTLRSYGFVVPRGRGSSSSTSSFPDGEMPTVLVGLSTTYQSQEDLLQRILDALADLPVRALVTTSHQVDSTRFTAPTNTTVTEFVPHQSVLPDTDVMVTHGGLGSIAGAFSHGVPLVCAPLGRDQFVNAERVAALDAGVSLGATPTSSEIGDAVMRVLSDPRYRRGAEAVDRESRAAGGATALADDLERLVSARR